MNKFLTILLFITLPLMAQEERIISLSPALTELVFKLGKGRQLIARSEPCDYPPEVKKLPVAGRFADPDMERILTLRPTLVITNDLINPGVRTVMENAKIRCIQKQCSTIEEYVEWVKL
ncbi:MAG: ABC transporter substrate-binding protein, partial [Victivallales bacterium]|nr:ABC transporter substrate-binding protein [Victivallales bacterium]